jgi:hypothetical protein
MPQSRAGLRGGTSNWGFVWRARTSRQSLRCFMDNSGRGRFIQDQSLQSETSSLQHDLRQSGLWRLHIWERILSPLT